MATDPVDARVAAEGAPDWLDGFCAYLAGHLGDPCEPTEYGRLAEELRRELLAAGVLLGDPLPCPRAPGACPYHSPPATERSDP